MSWGERRGAKPVLPGTALCRFPEPLKGYSSMDTKRNLNYFTAPVVSPYTIVGLIIAGLLYAAELLF